MLSHRMGLSFSCDETCNQSLHHKGMFSFMNMNVLYLSVVFCIFYGIVFESFGEEKYFIFLSGSQCVAVF